ncbi:MAG: ABC transporter permease [Pseudomonadota bacterium]
MKKKPTIAQSLLSSLNPLRIATHFWQFRELVFRLSLREILTRYRGSFLGISWVFIQPLLLLSVYTFVFSVIFDMKWGTGVQENRLFFAMALFVGILTFNIFGEVANAAPTLILSHQNYAKKVVFPLEILPVVKLLSVLVHSVFGMVIVVIGVLFVTHTIPWTLILLPAAWLPMIIFALGWGFLLAALGVFIRDIGVSVGVLVNMLFFLSPVFYPIEAVPEQLRVYCRINPIAVYIQDARRVVLLGQPPDWPWFLGGLAVAFLVFAVGFAGFMRSKRAFADVL